MGYRLVRWCGDPDPYADRTILKGLAYGTLPVELVERLRFYDTKQRVSVLPRRSENTLGPTHGFSRTYVFTAEAPFQWMDEADAALLFGNEWDRWQYLDVTDAPYAERPPLTPRQWRALMASFDKLDANRRLRPEFR